VGGIGIGLTTRTSGTTETRTRGRASQSFALKIGRVIQDVNRAVDFEDQRTSGAPRHGKRNAARHCAEILGKWADLA
jgi:hypothetical protein